MRRRLISLTSLTLACIIFYFSSGYYLIFFLQQLQIRECVEQHLLSEKQMEVLVFTNTSKDQIKWLDDEEFIFNDSQYDVKSIYEVGNTTYIKCYKDVDERQLLSNLHKQIKNNLTSSGQQTAKVKTMLCFAIFEELKKNNLIVISQTCQPYSVFSEQTVSSFHKAFSPPPEHMLA